MSIYYDVHTQDDTKRREAKNIDQGLQDVLIETGLDIIPLSDKERRKAKALIDNAKDLQDPKKQQQARNALSNYLRRQIKKIEKDRMKKNKLEENKKYNYVTNLIDKVDALRKKNGIRSGHDYDAITAWRNEQQKEIEDGDTVSIITLALCEYTRIENEERNREELLREEAERDAQENAELEARIAARRTATSIPTSTHYTPASSYQGTQTKTEETTPIIGTSVDSSDLVVEKIETYVENNRVVYYQTDDRIEKTIRNLDHGEHPNWVGDNLRIIDIANEMQRQTAKYDKAKGLFGAKNVNVAGHDLFESVADVALRLPSDLLGKGVTEHNHSEQGQVLYKLRKKLFNDDLMETYTKFYDSFMHAYGKLDKEEKQTVLKNFWESVERSRVLPYDEDDIKAAIKSGRFITPDDLKHIVNEKVAEGMIKDKVGYIHFVHDEYNRDGQNSEIQRKITQATKYMEPSDITSIYHVVRGKAREDYEKYGIGGTVHDENISNEEREEQLEAQRKAHERTLKELQDNYAKVIAKKLTKEEKKEAEEKGMSEVEYVCDKYFHEKYLMEGKNKDQEQRKGKEEELTPEQKTAQRLINPKDAAERRARVNYFRKDDPIHLIVDKISGKQSKFQKLWNKVSEAETEEEARKYVSEMEKMYPVSAKKVKKAVENLGLDYDTEVERAGRGR